MRTSVLKNRLGLGLALILLVWVSGCAKFGASTPPAATGATPRPQLAASAAGLAEHGSSVRSSVVPDTSTTQPRRASGEFRYASSDNPQAPYRLRQGDPVLIYLRGILPKDDEVQDIIDEKGYVTLPYIDDVMALGKTASELEREVQRIYIERGIYRTVTVNVIVPSQSFFVQGEVRAPQRYSLITGMTVMQAIAAAGGYTEFADPRRVSVTRGSVVRTVNMRDIERDPKRDFMIESGDVIRVPRSYF